jgi:hypothetical protein
VLGKGRKGKNKRTFVFKNTKYIHMGENLGNVSRRTQIGIKTPFGKTSLSKRKLLLDKKSSIESGPAMNRFVLVLNVKVWNESTFCSSWFGELSSLHILSKFLANNTDVNFFVLNICFTFTWICFTFLLFLISLTYSNSNRFVP